MENIITLDKLLNIGDTILNNAQKNKNILLNEQICNEYNIVSIKKKLIALFEDIKTAKYLYKFPEESIKITPNYGERLGSFKKTNTSQVEKIIDNQIDGLIYVTDLYEAIIKASYKLTDDESIYLYNAFLEVLTEEEIAEIIGISRTYLQKIKKSCIVKLWVELNKFVKED